MRDDFRFFRPMRGLIYDLLSLLNRGIVPSAARGTSFLLRMKQRSQRKNIESPRILYVYRAFGGSNEIRLRDLGQNLKTFGMSNVFEVVRRGNTFFGNARWLRTQILIFNPTHIVIADPQLIGFPGVIGVIQCLRLLLNCRSKSIRIALVLFDLQDPQGVLFASFLGESDQTVILTCSTESEAHQFSRLTNTNGPALEICFYPRLSDGLRIPFHERKIDVHLPRPSYEPRASLVHELSDRLMGVKLSLSIGGSFASADELHRSLLTTRIVVVTNSLICGSVGRWPRPTGPKKHFVSYNLEALQAGCLLVSEQCDALTEYLLEGTHYVSFLDTEDAHDKILFYLENVDEAERIAHDGHRRFQELVNEQQVLKSFILS